MNSLLKVGEIKVYYQGNEDTTGKIKWSKGVSEGGNPIILNVKLDIKKQTL